MYEVRLSPTLKVLVDTLLCATVACAEARSVNCIIGVHRCHFVLLASCYFYLLY